MLKQVGIAAGALLAVLLAACNPFAVLDSGDEQVATFQDQWSAGDLEAIWNDLHPDFREGVNRAQFDAGFGDFQEIFGPVLSSERENFEINSNNGVAAVDIVMRTQFENGEGIETFTMRADGDVLKVVYYFVESELLLGYQIPESDGRSADEVIAEKVASEEGN